MTQQQRGPPASQNACHPCVSAQRAPPRAPVVACCIIAWLRAPQLASVVRRKAQQRARPTRSPAAAPVVLLARTLGARLGRRRRRGAASAAGMRL